MKGTGAARKGSAQQLRQLRSYAAQAMVSTITGQGVT